MRNYIKKQTEALWNKAFFISSIGALILLFTSLVINYYAGSFATHSASNSVTDIILDNVAAIDVSFIFIYGSAIFWVFILCLLIAKPKNIPFILKSVALFIFVRSVSVSLTHIAPFAWQIHLPTNNLMHFFTFGGDLFFSGHTGLPFLLALLYWKNRALRYIFLLTSITFAIVVLLGHYHYSIDVFAAFFITPTIAHLSKMFFEADHKLFETKV